MDALENRREYQRQYRANNKEKIREKNRIFREKNKEHLREYMRKYRKKWSEKSNVYSRSLRAFINGCKDKCIVCGETDKKLLHFHHRDPSEKEFSVSQASSFSKAKSEMKKCDVLCFECHITKHSGEKVKCPTCGTIVRKKVLE